MTDIRRATAKDVPGCAAVVNAWIDATPWMKRHHTPEVIEGFIRDAFPVREIWVHGNPVDAYMSVDPMTHRIVGLYCAKTGQGIGKAFLDTAKAGRDQVWLTTHVPNRAAQKFYRREGFVPAEEIAPVPPETVGELRMVWSR